MAITWLGKTLAVRQFIAAVQASANANVDASEGSVTLALGQASTGAFLWLQALLAKILLVTRALTSAGADLDSFFADFFFTRLPAVASSGEVTFARFTPTAQAVVQVGQMVSTGPGGAQFVVILDSDNPAYSADLGGYVMAPAVDSVTVPVAGLSSGAAGNVLPDTITSFVTPISGVDTVTNADAIANGADAESDDAFRARFRDYISGLRLGTIAAIRAAVTGTRAGLTVSIIENKQTDGVTDDKGFLTLVVDDGSGDPSQEILDGASLAVDMVRAAGIRFGVIGPTIQNNTVTMTVVSKDGAKHANDVELADDAVTAYINSLAPGDTLIWARLFQVAFDSSSNITGVNNLLLNGGSSDVAADAVHVNKATVTVT